jgi:hypothetical protein
MSAPQEVKDLIKDEPDETPLQGGTYGLAGETLGRVLGDRRNRPEVTDAPRFALVDYGDSDGDSVTSEARRQASRQRSSSEFS